MVLIGKENRADVDPDDRYSLSSSSYDEGWIRKGHANLIHCNWIRFTAAK